MSSRVRKTVKKTAVVEPEVREDNTSEASAVESGTPANVSMMTLKPSAAESSAAVARVRKTVKKSAVVEPQTSTSNSGSAADPNPSLKPSAAEIVDVNTAVEAKFIVDREKQYVGLTAKDLLLMGMQLDSDVYRITEGAPEIVIRNKSRFVTNDSFISAAYLNKYLTENGKIPAWLEIRDSGDKGYGVFTKKSIPKGTYLGHYEGEYRVYNGIQQNKYCINVVNNAGQPLGYVDSENITFANWSRFINDGANVNVEFCIYNCQVYLFTLKDVVRDSELLVDYGVNYWNKYGPKLD